MQQDYGTSRGGAGSSGSSWGGPSSSYQGGSSYGGGQYGGQGPSTYGGKERFEGGAGGSKEGEFSGIKGHQGDLNWVLKDVSHCKVNPSELMHVHMGLVCVGHCYIQEHVKMLLLGGSQGLGPESTTSPACKVIKQWHDNVTIPNLHILTDVAKKLQLPLPFVEPLEQREHSIKRAFQQIGRIEPVLKDHEALLDLKLDAMNASHYLLKAIHTAHCQVLKDAFKECFHNICNNFDTVKDALCHAGCVPPPVIKSFAVVDTGVTSHTGSVKDKAWGYGTRDIPQERTGGYEQGFGQQQRPFDTQRDVGGRGTRQIPIM